jgi:putative spermidine/putrescine transport system substrate-binding protein
VRHVNKTIAGLAVLSLVLAACGDDDDDDAAPTATTEAPATEAPGTTAAAVATTAASATDAPETVPAEVTEAPGTTAATGGGDVDALYQECLDNGATVNLIALPDEWANYKGILQSFRDKYPGVENPVADPDASSADEMEAVETLAGQDNMPDSVDVSPAIAQQMVDKDLFEPYTLTVDSEVPEGLKDADHNWNAAYYGIMAISTNTTIVDTAPQTFADLEKPEYQGLVNLNGDPRESGAAFAAVMAASFANGGSADDIMPGIEFFAALKESGNLGGTDVTKETVLSGETPIAIDWSYNVPGLRADLEAAGLTVETHFPSDGIYGGFYGQGVVKDSPHNACSKLWMEHIFSDEGALGYLEGGAVPARIVSLTERGLVTDDMKVNLPPDELLSQVSFLTPAQIAAASDVLAENWGPMVADA